MKSDRHFRRAVANKPVQVLRRQGRKRQCRNDLEDCLEVYLDGVTNGLNLPLSQ
jgi:hypothetical protein